MLVYITKHNFSKIVRKIPLNSVNLEGQLYARYNQILNTIFSKYEKTELLLYKMLSEDPKKFLYEVYAKVQDKEDTYMNFLCNNISNYLNSGNEVYLFSFCEYEGDENTIAKIKKIG